MVSRPKTILCVEQEGTQREERAAALSEAGFDVILTQDVREALRIFISHELDAVLLELRLGNGKKSSLRAEMSSIRPRVPLVALCPDGSKSSTTARFFSQTFRDGKGNSALIALLHGLFEEVGRTK